jgi:site-specific recombinase XerD
MPFTRNEKAVLEVSEVTRALLFAKVRGPLEHALLTWIYEWGARASEPGLQLVKDVDLRMARARAIHLKHGAEREWDPLLKGCREVLPPWLEGRQEYIVDKAQLPFLFPSPSPGVCYPCRGTGKVTVSRQKKTQKLDCYHCGTTGKRWGVSRYEVESIVDIVLRETGVEEERRHPHVFRHSIITHLLEAGVDAVVIQQRVGHRQLATTLGYVRATKKARDRLDSALERLRDEDERKDD